MSVQQQAGQDEQTTHKASTEGVDLLRDERVLVNRHPGWSVWSTQLIIGAIMLLVGLSTGSAEGIMAGVVIGGGIFGVVYLGRQRSRYVITSERVKSKVGLLSSSSREYRISDIESISTEASLIEGLLGLGNISYRTSANDGIKWEGVPDHEQAARQVREMRRQYDKKHVEAQKH